MNDTRTPYPSRRLLVAALAAAGLLAACGGGDDAAPAPAPAPATPTTTVSGSVVKGPVTNADVCAYKATPAGKGEQIACVKSGAAGTYSLNLNHVGDVVIEASGGTYVDEATGATRSLSDPMLVVLNAQGGNAVGVVTPLTTIAYNFSRSATGGVTSANFAAATTNVATQFQLGSVNIAATVPVVAGTTNAYGNVLRAVARYIANGGSLATLQTFSNPAAFQSAFNTAFAAINGTTITFNFTGIGGTTGGTGTGTGTGGTGTGGTGTGGTGTGGTGTGTGTGGTGGTGGTVAGNRNLTIAVTVAGVTSNVVLNNVPAPTTQAEFCSGLQSSTTFQSLASAGGTLTINSCSFNGTVGNIAATLTAQGFTLPYTIVYTYN